MRGACGVTHIRRRPRPGPAPRWARCSGCTPSGTCGCPACMETGAVRLQRQLRTPAQAPLTCSHLLVWLKTPSPTISALVERRSPTNAWPGCVVVMPSSLGVTGATSPAAAATQRDPAARIQAGACAASRLLSIVAFSASRCPVPCEASRVAESAGWVQGRWLRGPTRACSGDVDVGRPDRDVESPLPTIQAPSNSRCCALLRCKRACPPFAQCAACCCPRNVPIGFQHALTPCEPSSVVLILRAACLGDRHGGGSGEGLVRE